MLFSFLFPLQHGDNAIYWAARQGQTYIIEYLKEHECPLNQQNRVSIRHVDPNWIQVPEAGSRLAPGSLNNWLKPVYEAIRQLVKVKPMS